MKKLINPIGKIWFSPTPIIEKEKICYNDKCAIITKIYDGKFEQIKYMCPKTILKDFKMEECKDYAAKRIP